MSDTIMDKPFDYTQVSQPTAKLRWRVNIHGARVLQQAFHITHYHNDKPTSQSLEWREIPESREGWDD